LPVAGSPVLHICDIKIQALSILLTCLVILAPAGQHILWDTQQVKDAGDDKVNQVVDGLRLVDWSATAFDAELHTVARRSVRQRISQRAVQDISSIGDAAFMHSLQSRLIGLFDEFRYRRIGIACRLHNQVCRMSGLSPIGTGFTIIEGAGLPRLNVIGFNREVDWPTLIERVMDAAGGDVSPDVR